MFLLNGENQHQVDVSDRGFQYGDGLFETIEILNGQPVFWRQHLQRLRLGCQQLAIPMPDAVLLTNEARQLAQNTPRAVMKLIVTRGTGGRGYRQPPTIQPTRLFSLHPFPDYPESFQTDGVVVRFCEHRLGKNPALAGIKHCNRLEQILARAEWDDDSIQEGIMLDSAGLVIEATMSNVFMVKNRVLYTPPLHECGVKGVMRGVIIECAKQLGLETHEQALLPDVLLQADELLLTNAIIGIWPVQRLAQQSVVIGQITRQLQTQLHHHKQADLHSHVV